MDQIVYTWLMLAFMAINANALYPNLIVLGMARILKILSRDRALRFLATVETLMPSFWANSAWQSLPSSSNVDINSNCVFVSILSSYGFT
jgi:hypothetical protein